MPKILTGAEHHVAAAEHHEQAAVHDRPASMHYLENNYALAAHQASIACGHMQRAARHGNEPTKRHLEQNGKELRK